MVRLISIALLVTIHSVLLHGSKRTVKMVHKPYGPQMCKTLCADSTGNFLYIKEDLSCRIVSPSNASIMNNRTSGLFRCIKKDRMFNGSLALTLTVGKQRCHTNSKGKEMSDELELIVNKANATHGYNEALHEACKKGNLCLAQYILFHKLADINCRARLGRTPAMVSARAGQASVFDFLLRKGCDLIAVDNYNDSLLHMACKNGDVSIVMKLVDSGSCDIEGKGWRKWTPVMTAACYGNERVFDFLVSVNCTLTAVDVQNHTILHLACEGGKTGIVNYILENTTSDIERKEMHGRTPVMIAAENGHVEVIHLLVNKGCDLSAVDERNNTILHLACIEDNADAARYLLSQNITNIESRGNFGSTSFMSAAGSGRLRVAKLLVEKGCNITAVDDYQNNAFHMACIGGHVAMVKYLLSLNINCIESRGFHGMTPFLVAAKNGYIRVAKLLFEKDCNITAVDNYQNNALHVACIGSHVAMVKYLLSQNISTIESRGFHGRTPFLVAAENGYIHVAKLLIEKDCNVTAVDEALNTALHLASKDGHVDMVRYLSTLDLFNGKEKNTHGLTPIKLAESRDRVHVVAFLKATLP